MHRLDHKGCVRVGDFGLAEDMYSRGYVREDSRTVKIPYKWMPPESLEDALFSELSDVVRTHTPIISSVPLILIEERNALLAHCTIYTRVTTGTKLFALIVKLEIRVWHRPGKNNDIC